MEIKKYYAGIGSRKTPFDILLLMTEISSFIGKKYILRSGGAEGADLAFEEGARNSNFPLDIFKAEDCTKEAMNLSSKYHPNWKACSPIAKKLHGRNAMILLGKDLNTPVERVICWTPKGEIVGGTGQAIRIAQDYGIKIYNLDNGLVKKKFYDLLSYW